MACPTGPPQRQLVDVKTRRDTPCSAQRSSTFCVPCTFTDSMSASVMSPCASRAAKWKTVSMRGALRKAAARAVWSRMSTRRFVKRSCSRTLLTMSTLITRAPRASTWPTKKSPKNPEPPVTRQQKPSRSCRVCASFIGLSIAVFPPRRDRRPSAPTRIVQPACGARAHGSPVSACSGSRAPWPARSSRGLLLASGRPSGGRTAILQLSPTGSRRAAPRRRACANAWRDRERGRAHGRIATVRDRR
mmetsp:Transcript_37509/g.87332  ORF Transcript_37509/g.87332 Transcript_37509/m.87332 type:complete len:246 (-) Transcript_37509:1450-2187(-)